MTERLPHEQPAPPVTTVEDELVASSVLQDLQFAAAAAALTSTPASSSSSSPPPARRSLLRSINVLTIETPTALDTLAGGAAALDDDDEDVLMTLNNGISGEDESKSDRSNVSIMKSAELLLSSPVEEIAPDQWTTLVDQLPSTVLRKLMKIAVGDIQQLRECIHNSLMPELLQWRDARLSALLMKLKKQPLKTQIALYIDRLSRLVSVASDCWEEQHALVMDYCRVMEPYLFGGYELGCEFRQQFSLCVEIFWIVLEGSRRLCKVPTPFDIGETLAEWKPDTGSGTASGRVGKIFGFESSVLISGNSRGFLEFLYRVWSHVLHIAATDESLQSHPTQLHQLFAWSVKHDSQRKLGDQLSLLAESPVIGGTKALELYEHYLKRKRAAPHEEEEESETFPSSSDKGEFTQPDAKRIKLSSSPRKGSGETATPTLSASGGSAGSSCHQCKSRRNVNDLIFCTNVVLDKKNKSCRKKYCEHCLKKFYHEDAKDIPDRGNWSCPSCRKLCCCAACRRKDNRESPMMSPFESPVPFLPRAGTPASIPSLMVAAAAAASVSGAGGGKVVANGVAARTSATTSATSTPMLGPASAQSSTTAEVNNGFAMMYAASMIPAMQKTISETLARKDLSDNQKVELISSMLQQRVTATPSAPTAASSSGTGNSGTPRKQQQGAKAAVKTASSGSAKPEEGEGDDDDKTV
eukprot:TRINITY_DN12156_c0_g1_i1.p1 TRINITY_DN12156_c0_g1~~TRINITY_DN12156_c0_g1_i1.p1  ORF type:complete len:722 (-),score=157.48 TRINITY_DN12156_c0_g1_i1:402-2489(-)